MIVLNRACPQCGGTKIATLGNHLTDNVCIIECRDCGYKVSGRVDHAPGNSLQADIRAAEDLAAALWAGAETCVSCGRVIPEGRQVCPGCQRRADNG